MSRRSDRKRQQAHPATVNAMIDDAAYEQGPRGSLERKKPEWATRSQNADMRQWLADDMARRDPEPGQLPDTLLGTMIGLKKRSKAMFKPEADDVEAARRLSKLTGYTFEECLKAYSDVNEMNTPSYEGGTLIQKKGEQKAVILEKLGKSPAPPTSAQAPRLAALAEAGTVDGLVVKALQHRASELCGVEAIKAARSRPIAYGDLGIISMMRHGRR
jgi:hypothetical protein